MTTSAAQLEYVTGDYTGQRVLVTGASGVLGSGVARALDAAGAQVTVLQRSASGIPGVREVRGSVTNPQDVATALEGVDSVIHIAAKVSVSGPLRDYEHVNVEGTRTLLHAARRSGRSEERRVGKEGRTRWGACHGEKRWRHSAGMCVDQQGS